jgi:hypothetical protein
MASRGLCSLGESELMTDAARLLFGEEPTEPDLQRASAAAPPRELLRSRWYSSDPYEDSESSLPPGYLDRKPTRDATDGS